jgi:hypothetical protein
MNAGSNSFWNRVKRFLRPGTGAEVAGHLAGLDRERAERIGDAALKRVREKHT